MQVGEEVEGTVNFVYFLLFIPFPWDKISLFNQGWPGNHN
jgi:hypothetical protein